MAVSVSTTDNVAAASAVKVILYAGVNVAVGGCVSVAGGTTGPQEISSNRLDAKNKKILEIFIFMALYLFKSTMLWIS
jgi:hypothetical protein